MGASAPNHWATRPPKTIPAHPFSKIMMTNSNLISRAEFKRKVSEIFDGTLNFSVPIYYQPGVFALPGKNVIPGSFHVKSDGK